MSEVHRCVRSGQNSMECLGDGTPDKQWIIALALKQISSEFCVSLLDLCQQRKIISFPGLGHPMAEGAGPVDSPTHPHSWEDCLRA
jgi:hypothetical protein